MGFSQLKALPRNFDFGDKLTASQESELTTKMVELGFDPS